MRLKNLLRRAEQELLSGGVPRQTISDLLEPAWRLEEESGFWREQSDGLALFLAPGSFQYFRVPIDFDELVFLGDRFEIQPILPFFTVGQRFYLLALNQKHIRMFEGTQTPAERTECVWPSMLLDLPLIGLFFITLQRGGWRLSAVLP